MKQSRSKSFSPFSYIIDYSNEEFRLKKNFDFIAGIDRELSSDQAREIKN